MLYYTLNNLDSYIIDTCLKEQIESEISKLDNIISIYKNKEKTLQNMTITIINITNNIEENKIDNFYNTSNSLKETIEKNANLIQHILTLKASLLNILELINTDSNNTSEIKNTLIEYNRYYEKIEKDINSLDIEITNVFNSITTLSLSNDKENLIYTISENFQELKKSKITDISSNNILIVSEKDQKAYLPYNYSEIEKIYENKKHIYTCIQDVIEKLYILPLKNFKNSTTSRFREGFKLIKERENGSTLKALSLGLELMFKYKLNPIVIAACRNIDELDIYIDCLEENELNAFNCFQIRFEITPKI